MGVDLSRLRLAKIPGNIATSVSHLRLSDAVRAALSDDEHRSYETTRSGQNPRGVAFSSERRVPDRVRRGSPDLHILLNLDGETPGRRAAGKQRGVRNGRL